jgi:integrase
MPIYQDKRGRYHVAFMQGGRRVHRVCPAGTSKARAVEYETKLRQEVFRVDRLGQIPDYSLGEAILAYLNEAPQKWRKDLDSKARRLAPYAIGKTLTQIGDIAEAYKKATRGTLAIGTINRRLALLRRVASLSFEKGWLEKPILIKLIPGERPRETYLTRARIDQLARAQHLPQVKAAIYIAAYSGLRSAEILALQPADVRGGLIRVRKGKGGKARIVPVVLLLRPWLRMLPIGLHPSTLSHAVSRAMPGVRFHDLRHSCASLLLAAGVDLYTISKILGHSTIQVTQRYSHLETKALKKAMRKIG